MLFRSIISSPLESLSLQQALHLSVVYLENARKEVDPDIALVLCHDAEVSLSHVKKAAKNTENNPMREGIATIHFELGELLDTQGFRVEAQAFYKKSEKWGGRPVTNRFKESTQALHNSQSVILTIPRNIFPDNLPPPAIVFNPPQFGTRLSDTRQLACCLGLLQVSIEPDDILDVDVRKWVEITKSELDEMERLKTLATDVIRAFKRDEFKDAKSVTEVVFLAPVLERDDYRYLVKEFYSWIDQSGLLDVHQLEGLAHLMQGAGSGDLDSDDLVKVLTLLSTRLRDIHQQSTNHLYQLTMAMSHVLDAMADASIRGLDREKIHEPLSFYLDGLKASSDPYLVYQAAYAYQALLCVPDNETLWHAALRRTEKDIQGVSGLVRAVQRIDLNGFIQGLEDIQQRLSGVSEIAQSAESDQGFFECLKGGFGFSRKCAWYTALRGADILIRDGQLAELERLIREAPCRRDAAFQWGVCQRLGEVAANPKWDTDTRRSAITFLGEIYQDDNQWGQNATVKQWIMAILSQLSLGSSEMQFAELRLRELRTNGDEKKQALYRDFYEKGPVTHPLTITLPEIGSPSLLHRVQERTDVETNLRQLRRQRLRGRMSTVYIPPQAKSSLQAPDEARFPLFEKVAEFLESDQMVFLVLGESGAGKSTFNRELECHLWSMYKKNGFIPLHINLPAIDKPEQDMIAKQLRRSEFTEPEIRELKMHRRFILICDGYDESQQTHNLYTSNRLNQPGEWSAQMVISCRSEYLGVDYRDRFQPGDRNRRSESLLQEAVIAPFSMSQVQDFIAQYVSVHRPLWQAHEYEKAIDSIPSLKDLITNPFLMALSMEVLPRTIDPGQNLSITDITRTALYDQFIEHWLKRGKERLGEKNLSPQARLAFERLVDEGFTQNGIDYLKELSGAIYKEQDGHPIVTYSRYKDENSWKAPLFGRDEEKQILREACPLTRNGNQYRFIHRSMLEFGLSLAVFDPRDWKERTGSQPALNRRGSTSSLNSEIHDSEDIEQVTTKIEREPDTNSPLVWRSFVNEPSILQFLDERVLQEPVFRQQLFDFIAYSKRDKKWRFAAANAITILIRAGVQFNGEDLRGIKIPGANLSNGMFDSAQLQGADLRGVKLYNVWLRHANLSGAQMAGTHLDEMVYFLEDSEVRSCAFSTTGDLLAVGLSSGTINVYETSDWEKIRTLSGHTGEVTSVVFSLKNDQLASSSVDQTVRLWDVATERCQLTFKEHRDRVNSVAYSPRSNLIASASDDRTVLLWNPDSGACNQILEGHDREVTCAVYSPEGDYIVSGSKDCTVRLWEVETGNCLRTLCSLDGMVKCIAYSPRGDQVASSIDDTVRLWDVQTGECNLIMEGHTGEISSIVFSANGDLVITGSEDMAVRVWDATTGSCRHTINGDANRVTSVAISPKNNLVASGGLDKMVHLWNIGSGTSLDVLSGHDKGVLSVENSPTGNEIASSSRDHTVRIWDVKTGVCRHVLRGHKGTVGSIAYSPQGDLLATGGWDNAVKIWDAGTGECRHTLEGHSKMVGAVIYCGVGLIASASDDGTVRLWAVDTGDCRHILRGHKGAIETIAYSPSGKQIASGSSDNTVRLWNVESGVCLADLSDHSGAVTVVIFSPNGDGFVSGSRDFTLKLWNATSEMTLYRYTLRGHSGWITCAQYSPNGSQVASGSRDKTTRLWNTETGACLWILSGHAGPITKVVYSPGGDLISSGSVDRTVRLWDVASGDCIAAIRDFHGSVRGVSWSTIAEVIYLVTGSSDKSVRAWLVSGVGESPRVRLHWSSAHDALAVADVSIQDVQGLSIINRQLLKRRGAVGEPMDSFRKAGKKVLGMISVVSKLKLPHGPKLDSTLNTNLPSERSQQPVDTTNGS